MTSKYQFDEGERALTYDEMRALVGVEPEQAPAGRGAGIMHRFPMACPHRAALLDRALDGDPEATRAFRAGLERVILTRRAEATRHLPGKHDQKSHGRKGGADGGDVAVDVSLDSFGGLPAPLQEAYEYELESRVGSGALSTSGSDVDDEIRGAAKSLVAERLADAMSDVPVRLLVEESTNVGMEDQENAYDRRRELRYNKALIETDYMVKIAKDGDLIVHPEEQMGDLFGLTLDAAAAEGWVRSGTPEAEMMVRRAVTSRLVSQWAETSNDASPRSLAIQRAVEDSFDVSGSTSWSSAVTAALPGPVFGSHAPSQQEMLDRMTGERYNRYGEVYRGFVKAQYAETQRFLAVNDIGSMTLVRGVKDASRNIMKGDETYSLSGDGTEFATRGVEVRTRPISSWSNSVAIAADFATDGYGQPGTVMAVKVPASRIFATPVTGVGCLSESEVVVLGGKGLQGRMTSPDPYTMESGYTPTQDWAEALALRAASQPVEVEVDIDDEHADWITVVAERNGRTSDRQLLAQEETEGSARHLPGKHDQKTHGRKSGTSGARYAAETIADVYGSGATLDPLKGYSSPTTGICVARRSSATSPDGVPYGKIVKSEDFFSSPDTLVTFVEERHDTFFTDKGAGKFGKPEVGIWHNLDDGMVYLDVTDVVPSSQKDAALELGREQNQIKVFDLDTMEEIDTGGTGRGRQAEPGSHRVSSDGLGQEDRGAEARVGPGSDRPDEAEAVRHFLGKHNQKSHAGGGGSGAIDADAVDARRRELVDQYGGEEAAKRARGQVGDAALFDLAGYSGKPTVLSRDEFDAYEGQTVKLWYDGPTSTFGRGLRSRPSRDITAAEAADSLVNGDYYVGTGRVTNGIYVAAPSVAKAFTGNLDEPGEHSVVSGDSAFVRVKIKPGTKVVSRDSLSFRSGTSLSLNMKAVKKGVQAIIEDDEVVVLDRGALAVEEW